MNKVFKVDFMIIGSHKCATSTLFHMLNTHPKIVGCDTKEPMFFCSCDNWRNEISDYHSLFQWKEGALHFEASTTYTFYPHQNLKIWESLYDYNPDLKLIYIVRNPIDRLISNYMHSTLRGAKYPSLEKFITYKSLFLDITRYATQIKPFIHQFGKEQVCILFFQDVINNPDTTLLKLSNFLNIDFSNFSDNLDQIHANKSIGRKSVLQYKYKVENIGLFLKLVRRFLPFVWNRIAYKPSKSFKEKPQLTLQTQEMILYLLRQEIDELEIITGRDLSSWREIREVKGSINSN